MTRYVFIGNQDDKASFRGGGRIMQVLRENLSNSVAFVSDLSRVNYENALLIPSWQPFQPSRLDRRVAKRQILMIFDMIPLKYPRYFPAGIRGSFNLWRNKRALKYFDKIITISEYSKKDIIHYLGIPANKIEVVYPAIGSIFLRHSEVPLSGTIESHQDPISHFVPSRMTNSKYCLYVGDVNWNKNLVNLARAIKLGDIPCVFVGKPFHTNLIKGTDANFAKSLGSTRGVKREQNVALDLSHPWQTEFKQFLLEVGNGDKRFIFAGYVPDENLISLYQNAVCNVLVSRDEGFGYSYAEAASQKCPSVLSDIDIFHETAGNTALFADPENPDDIAQKIKQLASNEKLRNDLGKKAYDNTKLRFSPTFFRKSLLDLLK